MAKRCNAVAMANLPMVFTSEGTMGLVYKAMSANWPNGLAYLVIKGLFKKYQPQQDMVTLVELRQMLNKISMKKDANLVTMFEQIASVKNRYHTVMRKIQEEELIAFILDKSTMDYKAMLIAKHRVRGTLLTLNDLKLVMNQHWFQISTSDEASTCPENGKGSAKGGFQKGGIKARLDTWPQTVLKMKRMQPRGQ
jgi:hypothetical protein